MPFCFCAFFCPRFTFTPRLPGTRSNGCGSDNPSGVNARRSRTRALLGLVENPASRTALPGRRGCRRHCKWQTVGDSSATGLFLKHRWHPHWSCKVILNSFLLFQKALQDSIGSKRPVLQADILVSLSSEAQMKGNTQGAIDLIHQALYLSERSGNLYGKARALGELGKLELQSGKNDEAASLIDQALDIDKLNGYKFEALHLFTKLRIKV